MRLPKQIVHTTKWTDRDSSRYALGGVRVGCRSGQCFAEATDGRRLVLLEWKDAADPVDCIMSGRELGTAVRKAKAKDSKLTVVDDALRINPFGPPPPRPAAVVNGERVPLLAGNWPKSEELFDEKNIGPESSDYTPDQLRQLASRVPVKIGGTTVMLSTKFLCDLADTAEAVGPGSVTLRAKDAISQVVCERNAPGLSMTAIIMPVAAD